MIVLQAVSFDTYIGTERFGKLTDDFLQGLLIECQYAMDYLGFLGSMYGFCGNGFPLTTAAALAVRIQNRFMLRRFSKRLSSSLQLFSAVKRPRGERVEATSLFSTLSKFSLFTFIFGNLLRAYDSFSACKDSSFSGIPYAYILK